MQWLFNLFYKIINSAMSLFDNVTVPTFVSDLITAVTKYCIIVNYYIPLSTLISVALTVVAVHIVLMIISAVLQIL